MMSFRGDRFSSLPLPTEREIFGYRHALNLIHTNAGSLSIAPGVLRQSAEPSGLSRRQQQRSGLP